jgi:FemAB family
VKAGTIEGVAGFSFGLPPLDWDDRQKKLDGHFLQSRAWAIFQAALGRQVLWAQGEDWSWLGALRRSRGIKYFSLAYGPTVAGFLTEPLESLREAGRQLGADFVRFEPVGGFDSAELQRHARYFGQVQPQHTLVLDLDRTEAELRSGLAASNRNRINTASKRGLQFSIEQTPASGQLFLNLLHATSERAGFNMYPDEYYQSMFDSLMPEGSVKLFMAHHEEQLVAAAVGFDYNGTRYYAHAAADQQLNKQYKAAVPLVWYMISDAFHQGYRAFDFWGVAPDDNPNHPWAGFTSFKKSFGGRVVAYAGTWDMPLKPLKYQLYRMAKRFLS